MELPVARKTLSNGLRIVLHEDHRCPQVAVNIWFHVGSKNEQSGKTGLSHFVEHLRFGNTKYRKSSFLELLLGVGAQDFNATTTKDRTSYFATVPSSALDLVLWLESDRMGYLSECLSDDKIEQEQNVILNEIRQMENRPYGQDERLIDRAIYPASHPYSWPVLGDAEDIRQVTLADIKKWLNTYYGASNAVISIAGDFETPVVLKKIEQYFGWLESGPSVLRPVSSVARLNEPRRQSLAESVPNTRFSFVWVTPGYGTHDNDMLRIAAWILGGGQHARLNQKLITERHLVTDIAAYVKSMEISGQFVITGTVSKGRSFAETENVILAEIDNFLENGVNPSELKMAQSTLFSDWIHTFERIGGLGGKADRLALNETFSGDACLWREPWRRIEAATTNQVQNCAVAWLSDNNYTLEIHPFTLQQRATDTVKRKQGAPKVRYSYSARLPLIIEKTLTCGIRAISVEDNSIPMVHIHLHIGAGFGADARGKQGCSQLTIRSINGWLAQNKELQKRLALNGARIHTEHDHDFSSFLLSAPGRNVAGLLSDFRDLITSAQLNEENCENSKKQQMQAIELELYTARMLPRNILPPLLYGSDHPYGAPFSGTGSIKSVSQLGRDDVVYFRDTWYHPGNAALVLVGDLEANKIAAEVENVFSGWHNGDTAWASPPEATTMLPMSRLLFVDLPGATQSVIAGGIVLDNALPRMLLLYQIITDMIGGLGGRIWQRLREEKNWIYQTEANLIDARGARMFEILVHAQADKTWEALEIIQTELHELASNIDSMEREFTDRKERTLFSLSSMWSTSTQIARNLKRLIRYGKNTESLYSMERDLYGTSMSEFSACFRKLIRPDDFIWVVIGDRTVVMNDRARPPERDIQLFHPSGGPV